MTTQSLILSHPILLLSEMSETEKFPIPHRRKGLRDP